MANVIITLKITPSSPDIDLAGISEKAKGFISEFGGEVGKEEIEPIGFGIDAIKLFFVLDESKGSTDVVEDKIRSLDEVSSAEVTDVRRAVG